MDQSLTTLSAVKDVVVEALGLGGRADSLAPATPLLTSVPELDSMAVLDVVEGLERRFGVVFDDEDVTADAFESLTSLTAMVERKLPAPD